MGEGIIEKIVELCDVNPKIAKNILAKNIYGRTLRETIGVLGNRDGYPCSVSEIVKATSYRPKGLRDHRSREKDMERKVLRWLQGVGFVEGTSRGKGKYRLTEKGRKLYNILRENGFYKY